MPIHKLAVLAGDGIGPEVMTEAIKLLSVIQQSQKDLSFTFEYFDWGSTYYLTHGCMLPEDGIEQLSHFDAILLGAVGDPRVPDHISLREFLLNIRHSFDQYVNIRPVKLLSGAPCPLANASTKDIDMIFIRENSEGEYAGQGSWEMRGTPEETVIQNAVFTRKGVERIIRYAFELAKREGKTLTSISKANALNYSMVFWDEVFAEVARDYPEVKTQTLLVDAAAMLMVKDPKRFQVVVCSNLFGDILTDLGAALAGGMGLAAGANINPERNFPSMFEPIHGSAPDIAGKHIANPLAMCWSVAQLLEHLGHSALSHEVLASIEELLQTPEALTPDMGGAHSTQDVGDALVAILSKRLA